ncbi:MAG: EVE domain-containing protein [Kofleriaceae bacterium]
MAKRCWLMKSEPDAFGIDDLARVRVEPWTGVRNFQARNFMRDEMHVGDDVLFYHSNASPSGVAGLATVHRTGVVDETQFEPSSPYYDPRATKSTPIWTCVEVAYVRTFAELVSLDDLRAEPRLADMLVLRRGMRLSVQPVSDAHFAVVCELGERGDAPARPARAGGRATASATTKAKATTKERAAMKASATTKTKVATKAKARGTKRAR